MKKQGWKNDFVAKQSARRLGKTPRQSLSEKKPEWWGGGRTPDRKRTKTVHLQKSFDGTDKRGKEEQ